MSGFIRKNYKKLAQMLGLLVLSIALLVVFLNRGGLSNEDLNRAQQLQMLSAIKWQSTTVSLTGPSFGKKILTLASTLNFSAESIQKLNQLQPQLDIEYKQRVHDAYLAALAPGERLSNSIENPTPANIARQRKKDHAIRQAVGQQLLADRIRPLLPLAEYERLIRAPTLADNTSA